MKLLKFLNEVFKDEESLPAPGTPPHMLETFDRAFQYTRVLRTNFQKYPSIQKEFDKIENILSAVYNKYLTVEKIKDKPHPKTRKYYGENK